MKKMRILLTTLIAGLCLLLAACGTGSQGTTDTAAPTELDPESLANEVVNIWSQSMQSLVALLEDRPDVSATADQVRQLKEDAIQQFVALGRQRETLSDSDKATVDSLEWSGMQGLAEMPWYASYNELWSYYSGLDREFANELAAFNTLTQYSDFILLKQQLPDEAARLGIE